MESASKYILLGSLVDLLKDKEFKKDFIQKLNANVDVPMFTEKTEEKVIKALYKLVVEQIELAIEKIKKED